MINKIRSLIILSACILAGQNTSLAGTRTEREMFAIAKNKLGLSYNTRSESIINKLESKPHYNVYGNSESFVIVSRDDSFRPVLAYSDTKYDPEKLPCGMEWWMERITNSMEQGKSAVIISPIQIPAPVDFFCKAEWGQGAPYNLKCPTFDGNKAPTGCVATSMAQIMKYYNYPAQGKGSGYYQKGGSAGRVTEPTTSVYEWEKMLDKYKGVNNLSEEQSNAISTLLKEAGLASHMNYDETGSGAFETSAAYGFCNNFSYDSLAMRCYQRQFFEDKEWMEMIYSELSNKRPILYFGSTNSQGQNGHAFIFDGFDSEGLIHVNWGWNGTGNGYYDISDLNPLDDRGKSMSDHYNYTQAMVIGFKCQSEPDPSEYFESFIATSSYSMAFSKLITKVTVDEFFNYNFLIFYGKIGVYFKSEDGKEDNNRFFDIGEKKGYTIAPLWGISGFSQTIMTTNIPAGKYTAFFASQAVQDKEPVPVRSIGGTFCYYVTVNDDGSVEASEQEKYVTNVSGVTSRQCHSDVFFDLKGRNLGKDKSVLPKGLYIIDGKKFVK